MDPWSIAAIGGFIASGLNTLFNYDSGTKAIKLAKEGQKIDRAQLAIDVNEFLIGMQQAELDLGGTLDSAKGSLLDLKERQGSLKITALDYSSKIASYDEFLARYPAYSELMVSEMDAQGKAEFRSLRENFGVSNVAAAERGQSGGSAQAMSSRAMQDLADYAGDDLSLGEMTTGNVGMFQMKKSELVLDLDAQYREAETQRGIFSTGLDQINTSIGDFDTAITDSEGHITDIENAIAGWDANYDAIEAYFADLLKEPETPPPVIAPVTDTPVISGTTDTGSSGTTSTPAVEDIPVSPTPADTSISAPGATDGLSDPAKEMFGVENGIELPNIYIPDITAPVITDIPTYGEDNLAATPNLTELGNEAVLPSDPSASDSARAAGTATNAKKKKESTSTTSASDKARAAGTATNAKKKKKKKSTSTTSASDKARAYGTKAKADAADKAKAIANKAGIY
jgi:hypothetical protein